MSEGGGDDVVTPAHPGSGGGIVGADDGVELRAGGAGRQGENGDALGAGLGPQRLGETQHERFCRSVSEPLRVCSEECARNMTTGFQASLASIESLNSTRLVVDYGSLSGDRVRHEMRVDPVR